MRVCVSAAAAAAKSIRARYVQNDLAFIAALFIDWSGSRIFARVRIMHPTLEREEAASTESECTGIMEGGRADSHTRGFVRHMACAINFVSIDSKRPADGRTDAVARAVAVAVTATLSPPRRLSTTEERREREG